MIKLRFSLITLLIFFSCSEHIPSEHEQAYLDTADSLSLYENVPYMEKELISNEKARDYLKLDYEEFKEKHEMTDAEMDVLSEIMQGHVDIARMLNSIEIR